MPCKECLKQSAQVEGRGDQKLYPRKEDRDAEYDSFWKEIVETDGKLDIEKVKVELYDFSFMMQEVPTVYMHVTGNRLSKTMYYASSVISEADAHMDEIFRRENEEAEKKVEGLVKALEKYAAAGVGGYPARQALHAFKDGKEGTK